MAILTKQKIEERLKWTETERFDDQSLVITPKPCKIGEDSIDLRLGCSFFVPRGDRIPCFIPGITPSETMYHEQYIPVGSFLVVPAHHTILGATLEYIRLPSNVSGEVLTKSSWARTFITIETAPWIHPLYRGCLTLEIANVSNTPIVLYSGTPIAQLVLISTSDNIDPDNRDPISGTYIGPIRPEPAQLKDPLSELKWAEQMHLPFVNDYLSHEAARRYLTERLPKKES
jgi:dCTP deaminase